MRVLITPKTNLDGKQLQHLTERIFAAEHAFDTGPRTYWNSAAYDSKFYVIVLVESQLPIGTIYVGGHNTQIDVAFWIDSTQREKGFASEAIDLLADPLKTRGVTGVGKILIDSYQGRHNAASSKLVARLRRHFSRDT
jgi:RimJ/RimL family protein N-acetyltransferase